MLSLQLGDTSSSGSVSNAAHLFIPALDVESVKVGTYAGIDTLEFSGTCPRPAATCAQGYYFSIFGSAMSLMLAKPGDVTDWICLSDIVMRLGSDVKDESAFVAERVRGVDIKIKTMRYDEYLRCLHLDDDSADPESRRALSRHALDMVTIRSGLADIRGAGIGMDAGVGMIAEDLAASGLSWLVAAAIRTLHRLPVEERNGFFTVALVQGK